MQQELLLLFKACSSRGYECLKKREDVETVRQSANTRRREIEIYASQQGDEMSNQEEEKVRVRRAVRFGLAVRAVRQCQSGLEVFIGIQNTPIPLDTSVLHRLPRLVHKLEEKVVGPVPIGRANKVGHERL